MISRQQYVGALTHPDFFVRSSVLRLLSDSRQPGLDITAAAVAAFEKYGMDGAFEFAHMISRFELDEVAARWALEKVRVLKNSDEPLPFHLLSWVCEMSPISLLRNLMAEIEDMAAWKSDTLRPSRLVDAARNRVALHDMPAKQCLSRLVELIEGIRDDQDFPDKTIAQATAICERLTETGEAKDELTQLATKWLAFDFNEEHCREHWYSGIAIQIAGLLRLEALVPRLIEHFDYDWEWWNELIQAAIKRMASAEVLNQCAGIYPSLEWHGRLYLGGVFEGLFRPDFVPALLKLLDGEEDDMLRVSLGAALALQGTPESRDAALMVYREDPSDPERMIIVETLYPQAVIEGLAEPELPKWRAKMEQMKARSAAAAAAIDKKAIIEALNESKVAPSGQGNRHDTIAPRSGSMPGNVRTVEFAAGRNDPCPCGSGKKFKKCCLGK